MLAAKYKELLKRASDARRRAYAPYSHYRVGAALLTAAVKVYTGCICAERTAVFKAISEGERSFRAIAIAADDPDFTPPCGACRQVLIDLAGNIDVILVNSKGRTRVEQLKDLLPFAFDKKHLQTARRTKK